MAAEIRNSTLRAPSCALMFTLYQFGYLEFCKLCNLVKNISALNGNKYKCFVEKYIPFVVSFTWFC